MWSTCRLIPYPFFGYLILGLGSQYHKVGYPEKGYGMSLQVGFGVGFSKGLGLGSGLRELP